MPEQTQRTDFPQPDRCIVPRTSTGERTCTGQPGFASSRGQTQVACSCLLQPALNVIRSLDGQHVFMAGGAILTLKHVSSVEIEMPWHFEQCERADWAD